ncbi:MAG: hypothetical protein UH625_06460 [Muribaculaceae bacterium]|nr:hypothetical protein [Muribaculaceae bacterium]
MKIFKLMVVALVAMLGFTACEKDCDHDFIEHDHSADLVGTWTCLTENYAEALIIKADGTAVSYGVEDGKYWENVKGTVTVKDNNITMIFEDDNNWTGHFDVIPGMAFSLFEENGERYIYNYCKEDLSEKIVGMWVCNDGLAEEENDMVIMTYSTEGKVTMTTPASTFVPTDFVNQVFDYKVVGDLLFKVFPKENLTEGANPYLVSRVTYTPNGTSLGDVLIENQHTPTENGVMELTFSFLRVKQTLDLAGQKYDYIKTYVSNVKGEDKDIPFLNTSFNFAKMDGSIIDKFLKSTLFSVEFPKANEIKYSFLVDGKSNFMSAPIEVEGNKMTIKMSANGPYHDVVVYTFQDQDNTQMHMYMPTTSFEKFFANTSVHVMLGNGQLKENDTEEIANVYKTIADAVESINLSIVMSQSK